MIHLIDGDCQRFALPVVKSKIWKVYILMYYRFPYYILINNVIIFSLKHNAKTHLTVMKARKDKLKWGQKPMKQNHRSERMFY